MAGAAAADKLRGHTLGAAEQVGGILDCTAGIGGNGLALRPLSAKLVALPASITVAVSLVACGALRTPPTATTTVTVGTPAPESSFPPAPSPSTVVPTPVAVGQKGIDGTFAFTVERSGTDDVVDFEEPDAATAQGIFVLVDIKIENVGNRSQTYSAAYQRLVDREGREFSPDTRAMTTHEYVKQNHIEINPGNATTAVLVFDVPSRTRPDQYFLLSRDSPYSTGVTLAIPTPPPPPTFAPTDADDQRFLQKLASDAGRYPSVYSPIWNTNPALAINVAHDACRSVIQKRHMTADDFGDLSDLLAQRWGVDRSLTGDIINNALGAYTNC